MPEIDEIKKLIDGADKIAIIQADNPDADSLGSALALESLLGDIGKEPFMYCALDVPEYLRHMPGWDRVSKDLPTQFDLSIIVDTSSITLLEKLENSAQVIWVKKNPCIVLDHHAEVPCDIPYATVVLNDANKVSTGELIYSLAKEYGWSISVTAGEYIMNSILADSMGLGSENTTAQTYRVMAELVELGVNRPRLEQIRRALTKMPEPIFRFKAKLIERTELYAGNKLALVVITPEEINTYSPLYNPNPLIQSEHLQTIGVDVSVAIKSYANGRITAAIRCGHNAPIADKIAKHFSCDGHAYAAGFKTEGRLLSDVKSECIRISTELLENLKQETV